MNSDGAMSMTDDNTSIGGLFRDLEIEHDNALLVESVLSGSAASSNLAELRLINVYLKRN
ncbi:hypothetical protein Gogos_006970 [Gossypium gossypioides]|uniref:Uncharacterized protein n=1 Tax=Gossypium gossypioides TaxID=34282 RepID=A0A7J9C792_GOSGO|nr:hypothetical protein [Gossypium gossypioides]